MLHYSTFEYLMPTDDQKEAMQRCRTAFGLFVGVIEQEMPDGPDKTYVMRKLREAAMWVNVGITRNSDGSPRT
jgi:hypothetical protein